MECEILNWELPEKMNNDHDRLWEGQKWNKMYLLKKLAGGLFIKRNLFIYYYYYYFLITVLTKIRFSFGQFGCILIDLY